MSLFDRFTRSFDDRVTAAIADIDSMDLGVTGLGAKVEGKFVTLTGEAPSMAVKAKVMEVFNQLVTSGNTLNSIRVVEPDKAERDPDDEPTETVYEVAAGDTLSGIAKRFYGDASLFMKIFEANRDILDDPDLIEVGQRLRIPEPEA
jgi:nucleoid-associated protein YgaU